MVDERNPLQCWAESPKGYYCCLPKYHGGGTHQAFNDKPHTRSNLIAYWPNAGAL